MSSSGRSKALHIHEALPLPVEIHGIRGAKRLRLRLDGRRNVLKLTGPYRMNRELALDWAAQQRDWVQSQLDASPPGEPFEPGASVPVEGVATLLCWSEGGSRSVRLEARRLTCGGPREGFARRIELFLKRLALETLSRETHECAERAGVTARSVSVGDAETRWGSCTEGGRIRYSWRLILAPPPARRYVVAHEVAHLVHLDHGPEFRDLERRLFDGDVGEARALLRRVAPRLRRIGRGS